MNASYRLFLLRPFIGVTTLDITFRWLVHSNPLQMGLSSARHIKLGSCSYPLVKFITSQLPLGCSVDSVEKKTLFSGSVCPPKSSKIHVVKFGKTFNWMLPSFPAAQATNSEVVMYSWLLQLGFATRLRF